MGFLKNLLGGKTSPNQPVSLTDEERRRRAEARGRAHAEASGARFDNIEQAVAVLKALNELEEKEKLELLQKQAKKEKINKEKSKYHEGFTIRTTPLTPEEIEDLKEFEIHCCIVLNRKNLDNLSKSRREDIFREVTGRGLRALHQSQSEELRVFLAQRVDDIKMQKSGVKGISTVPILFDEDDMVDGVRYISNANSCFHSDDYSDDYFAKNIYNNYLFDVSSEVNAEFKAPFAISVFINFHSPLD